MSVDLTTLLIALAAVVVACLVWRKATGTAKMALAPPIGVATADEFERILQSLLDHAYDFGFVIFSESDDGRFLQFRKHLPGDEEHYIELSMPVMDWSRPYIDHIMNMARDRGFGCFRKVAGSGDGALEFLYVMFDKNVSGAAAFSRDIVYDLFRLDPGFAFQVKGSDLGNPSETITRRDQLPLNTPDYNRY